MTDNTLYRSTTAIVSCKNKDFFTLQKKYFIYPKICSIFAFPNHDHEHPRHKTPSSFLKHQEKRCLLSILEAWQQRLNTSTHGLFRVPFLCFCLFGNQFFII